MTTDYPANWYYRSSVSLHAQTFAGVCTDAYRNSYFYIPHEHRQAIDPSPAEALPAHLVAKSVVDPGRSHA